MLCRECGEKEARNKFCSHRCCALNRHKRGDYKVPYWKGKKRPPFSTEWKKNMQRVKKGVFWGEDKVSYQAQHYRVKSLWGNWNYCEMCECTNKKYYDWANKDHKYRLIKEDWLRLCKSCHMKYDYKHNGRRNQHMIKNQFKQF